jgi:hypothetical protein
VTYCKFIVYRKNQNTPIQDEENSSLPLPQSLSSSPTLPQGRWLQKTRSPLPAIPLGFSRWRHRTPRLPAAMRSWTLRRSSAAAMGFTAARCGGRRSEARRGCCGRAGAGRCGSRRCWCGRPLRSIWRSARRTGPRPVVALDLLWNIAFVLVSAVVLVLSPRRARPYPLRFWIVGYAAQCILHMVCVAIEYRMRRTVRRPHGQRADVESGSDASSSSNDGDDGERGPRGRNCDCVR